MIQCRTAIALIFSTVLAPASVFVAAPLSAAELGILTAPEALRQIETGALILIDVRSVKEWRETSIPQGALAISIHDPLGRASFLDKVRTATGWQPRRPVGIICAAGVRSDRTQTWLLEAGYAPVLSVREGMMGHLSRPSRGGSNAGCGPSPGRETEPRTG